MTDQVRLPLENGVLTLDATALRIERWFLREAVIVPWSNVQFIHVVPAVRHSDGGWKTFRGEDITPESLRRGLRFYTIEPVLEDRHAVLADRGPFVRMWLIVGLLLKPLGTGGGQPHPKHGWMTLRLSRRGIRRSPAALLDALDLIQRVSRFDLLMYGG